LEHLSFFNKIINELLPVDVKIDDEEKVLVLLSSLSQSYNHIIIIMLYGTETLILEEVTVTANSIIKRVQKKAKSS